MADLIDTVSDVWDTVYGALKDIADQIYSTVRNIVADILEKLREYIEDIVSWIEEHWGLIVLILIVVIAVATAYYLATVYIPSFQAFVFSSPTLTKIYLYIAYVKHWLMLNWGQFVWKIQMWLNPYIGKIMSLVNSIRSVVSPILTYLSAAIAWVRASVLAKIYGVLSKIATFLFTIRIFTDIVKDLKDEKYERAAWKTLKYVDERLASEIEQVVRGLQAEIRAVRDEILDIIDSVQYDVRIMDQKAAYLEDTFRRMYEVFGVEVFGDVAREMGNFRRGVLEAVDKELRKAESWIMKKFRMALDPLVGILTMFYTVDRMYQEERWLVEAFAYVPYQDGFLRYGMRWTPVGMVPKPIYRLIFGG